MIEDGRPDTSERDGNLRLMNVGDFEVLYVQVGNDEVLVEFENGYKGIKVKDLPVKGRGGKGLYVFRLNKKSGKIKKIKPAKDLPEEACIVGRPPISKNEFEKLTKDLEASKKD